MRYILLLIFSFSLIGCVSFNSEQKGEKVTARITWYNGKDVYKGKRDKWGKRVAASSSLRSEDRKTCAAAKDVPFFTKVYIPALQWFLKAKSLIVLDRGSAVDKRIASKGKTPIIDIFLDTSSRELNKIASTMPQYTDVYLQYPDNRQN